MSLNNPIQDITLHNTLIRLRRGLEDNLPTEAPEGEPLLSMGPGQWKLWAGAGPGNPIQLIGGGATTGGASFIVNQPNHQLSNVFVMYNSNTELWEKAYASYNSETDTSYTAVGLATKIDDNQFTVTMLGEVIVPIDEGLQTQSLVDVEGNNLIPGEYYYLCQEPENAGKVQRNKPVFGVIQLVLQAISVDSQEGTKVVLFTQEAYDSEEDTYGGQQRLVFSNESLDEEGKFTITHALNTRNLLVSIYDNLGRQIIPDEIQIVDPSTINISLTNFLKPIEGLWTITLIGGVNFDHGVNFSSYTTTFSNQTEVTVNHSLGTLSVVTAVYDSEGYLIDPYKLQVVDLNTVKLFFDSEISGKIVISGNGVGNFTGIDFKTADDIPAGQVNKYFNEETVINLINQLRNNNSAVSDWLLINTGSIYTFQHNLSTLEYEVDYYVTDALGTTVKGCVNQTGDSSTGVSLIEMGPVLVKFAVGDNALFSIKSGTLVKAPTTGRLQVIIKKRNLS